MKLIDNINYIKNEKHVTFPHLCYAFNYREFDQWYRLESNQALPSQ